MSNIKTTRETLRSWIESNTRIDKWDSDPPKDLYNPASTEQLIKPANTGIEYPVSSLEYFREESATITGRGLFPYTICYRFPGELELYQLPLQRLEQVVETLQVRALLQLPGKNGIKEGSFVDNERYPIRIERDETQQNDWLIHITIVFEVLFAVTEIENPEEYVSDGETPEPEIQLSEIQLGIFRSKSPINRQDPETHTLDSELLIQ